MGSLLRRRSRDVRNEVTVVVDDVSVEGAVSRIESATKKLESARADLQRAIDESRRAKSDLMLVISRADRLNKERKK